jgi:serine/threonine protein kinase
VQYADYVILSCIGRGGMGEAWLARTPSGEHVVIKRIRSGRGDDPQVQARFSREASILLALTHENIARAIAFHEEEDALVMEHLVGWPFGRFLRAVGARRPPVGLCAFVVERLCRALAYLHGRTGPEGRLLGLVHRDVSPSNLFLCQDGGVKLLDFGVATALHDPDITRTTTGIVSGKSPFIAPERADGGRGDHRSDIFAAGVTLYLALTGQYPSFGEAGELLPAFVASTEPPAQIGGICARALAPRPEQRFESADEMADALGQVAAGERFDAAALASFIAQLSSGTEPTDPTAHPPKGARNWRRRGVLTGLVAGAAVLAVVAAVALYPRSPPVPLTPAPATPESQNQAPATLEPQTGVIPEAPLPPVAAPVLPQPERPKAPAAKKKASRSRSARHRLDLSGSAVPDPFE